MDRKKLLDLLESADPDLVAYIADLERENEKMRQELYDGSGDDEYEWRRDRETR